MNKIFSNEKITDRLSRINLPGNVCSFLAEGEDRALLIDIGLGHGSLKKHVETLTDKPYDVVLTHGHYDHTGGAAEFENCFIPEEDIRMALTWNGIEERIGYLAGNGTEASVQDMKPIPKREQ